MQRFNLAPVYRDLSSRPIVVAYATGPTGIRVFFIDDGSAAYEAMR